MPNIINTGTENGYSQWQVIIPSSGKDSNPVPVYTNSSPYPGHIYNNPNAYRSCTDFVTPSGGPAATCISDSGCLPHITTRKRLYYILLILLILGIVIMVFVVVSSTIIYVKYTQRMDVGRRPIQAKRNPCDEKKCSFGAECVIEDRTLDATCKCKQDCANRIGDQSVQVRFVCGTDGRTYENECSLRYWACIRKQNIYIRRSGTCEEHPCHKITCLPPTTCALDKFGVAQCLCPPECPPSYKPVCGSDGQNYDSECHLTRDACLKKTEITKITDGYCSSDVSQVCSPDTCPFGGICAKDPVGDIRCQCPQCVDEYNPVCGSDGVTYNNECVVRRQSCELQKQIHITHQGHCQGCAELQCKNFAQCEFVHELGRADCVCPQVCVRDDRESKVCGTDGVTYENECELQVRSCKSQIQITIASRSPCDACQSLTCRYGATCVSGRCICPAECPATLNDPVCATNSLTYDSECEMRRYACSHELDLKIAYYGSCDPNVKLPMKPPRLPATKVDVHYSGDGELDGETDTDPYGTLPESNDQDCRKQCLFGAVCRLDDENNPHCFCDFECGSRDRNQIKLNRSLAEAAEEDQVCGTDGKVYKSECFLRAASCQAQIEIRTQSRDYCRPSKENCICNKYGSYDSSCDELTGECQCRPGVGGFLCDRCEPGFWGLHTISEGSQGCIPCSCNTLGSVRQDCEQMSGRCVCKQGVNGNKCDLCPPGRILGEHGCADESIGQEFSKPCSELICLFGARCKEANGKAQCICDDICKPPEPRQEHEMEPRDESQMVCGTDGHTYDSDCHLKLYSCRIQESILIFHKSSCKNKKEFGLIEV